MNKRDIVIRQITYLRGPNIWTYCATLEALIDIGELEDCPSNTVPGLYERLTTMLPSLIEHRCSPGVRGGFLMRLQEGTWPCHIMEHVTLELQNMAGMPGGFGKARETSTRGVYKVVVSAYQDDIARAALQEARELLLAAIEDRAYDMAATMKRLRRMVDRLWLGPSTACIVEAGSTFWSSSPTTSKSFPFMRWAWTEFDDSSHEASSGQPIHCSFHQILSIRLSWQPQSATAVE